MHYARHDEALVLLKGYGPDLTNGMTSHVPMVAEAMAAMGQDQAALDWVERHRHTIVPRRARVLKEEGELWPSGLGQHGLQEEWSAFFSEEIRVQGWRKICDIWGQRLAPGFAAAASHGVIRVAHAARALSQCETDLRLRELADGLALWASTYAVLPAEVKKQQRLSAIDALKQVPLVPDSYRRNGGSITAALGQLKFAPEFADVINFVDWDRGIEANILDAAEAFAHVVVQNVCTRSTAIVFTHGVTGILAVRNLLPHVSLETARLLLQYGWNTGAALYAAYAVVPFELPQERFGAESVDRIARAVAHGDDHVIKLTEACLNFYADRPSQVFLKATDVVAHHLASDQPD